MPEHKPFLPPHIGKWLASKKPELLAKAEAALRASEPDANDFLLEREKKERQHYSVVGMFAFLSFQMVWTIVYHLQKHFFPPPHGIGGDVIYTLVAMSIAVPIGVAWIWLLIRWLVLPVGARYAAIVLKLAQRGDVRAVPLLLSSWLEPSPVSSDRLPDVENTLLVFAQNTAPGSLSFSDNPNAKDPVASLRAKFAKITRKHKGEIYFTKSATQTARRVQLWLALLPHLAADPNPKSRAVLMNLLDAQAKTLEEELIQNTARTLLYGATGKAVQQPATISTATPAPTESWKPAETSETPTLLQRLGRR